MIPSLELQGHISGIATVKNYAALESPEFNQKMNEAAQALSEAAEMLDENGE